MSFGLVQSGWGESECFCKNLAPGSCEVFKDIFRAYRKAPQYLKTKLQERYGNSVYISEGEALPDIVTMREQTSHILRSYFKNNPQEGDEASQKRAIIETAARLIKSDIKPTVPSLTDQYPNTEALKLDSALVYIPETLFNMLHYLFVGKNTERKVASIGQAIIQAVRPRTVIAPLQVGLAVQTHQLYRSKFLVDTLLEMGYCSSYGEVLRFEKNAASCDTPDLLVKDSDLLDLSLLFAADNVDHNILTIDGKGTFHGMGIIAAITPGRKTNEVVKRQKLSELNIVDLTKIDIQQYKFSTSGLRDIKFKELPTFKDCDRTVDVLWELSFHFKKPVPL